MTIGNSDLNAIDFTDQSIEIDTHNHRCSFKVLNLSILHEESGKKYEPLYNEVLGLTNDILRPSNGKIYEKRTSIW